ncbi:MAG: hypothetical protein E7464_02200 [Ruminococcaceae bacterium]|nr:hypothetical protein [Oscillospiraceae bacterium]
MDKPVENVKKFVPAELSQDRRKNSNGIFLYILSNNTNDYVKERALRLRFDFIIELRSPAKSCDFTFLKENDRKEKLVLTNYASVIIINERCKVRHAEVLE